MTESKTKPYAPRMISEGDIPVHKNLGEAAQTRSVGVPRPMPGIVILVHGVNDVGEAYQNQEKGILAGLSKRLNRQDFYPHQWKDYKITAPGRSPIIPFYWGYKPVTHDDYRADQKRYREEVGKLSDNAHLPYDAYQEDNETNKAVLGNDGKGPFKYHNDNFKNALDTHFAKNGGTFANATTTIPDNHPYNAPKTSDKPYTYYIDPESPDAYISYSAKASAIKRTDSAMYMLNSYQRISWKPGHVLTSEELDVESIVRGHTVIRGEVSGSKDYPVLSITWLKTREELENEWKKTDPVGYSQHSSIVMSEFAPSHAMAFDLAIGQCKSFDYKAGKFWEELLHRADWRDPLNGFPAAKEYYRSGRLPEFPTKNYMNKPDEVLPQGNYGVENDYVGIRPRARNPRNIDLGIVRSEDFQEVKLLQWEMPKPKSDGQLV